MYLGNLSETVVIVDTDFLVECINENLKLYKGVYPQKNFEKINLADLIYKLALNSQIHEAGNKVDIVFAYRLDNQIIPHCDPDRVFLFAEGMELKTDIGTFLIRSFFAEETQSGADHFLGVLSDVYGRSNVSRIVMVADSPEINDYLEYIHSQEIKVLFMLKNGSDTTITVPVEYTNISYPIAYSLGLKEGEL